MTNRPHRQPGRLGLMLAAFALALISAASIPAHAADTAADTATVRQVTLDDRKAVIATVEPKHDLVARTRIAGTIASLSVREGDLVKAGDEIAVVTDEKLALQMQGLEQRVEARRAELAKARLDYQRAAKLRESGTVAQAYLDNARTTLRVAERNLEAAHSDREVVKQQSREGAVLAPGDGRILTVPVQEGSVVMGGETVATLAADNYILRLQLPERHARFLREGDTILVGTRGMDPSPEEAVREGRVVLVYPEIDDGRVIADVEVKDLGDYFVGERTRVWVATGRRQALILPERFVYRRFGVSYVTLANGTEVVVQLGMPVGPVQTEGKNEREIEILAGLKAGDKVMMPQVSADDEGTGERS